MIRDLKTIVITGAVVATIAGAWLGWRSVKAAHIEQGRAEIRAEWDAANVKAKAEQDARETANKAAAAEAAAAQEAALAEIRDQLATRHQELRRATTNLRVCRLNADALRVLNAAAKRASEPAN